MSIYIDGDISPGVSGFRRIIVMGDGTVTDIQGEPIGKAIQLPPHGRLGDLDALERNLREMADYQHGDRQQGILGCCNTIYSAHTIIPADPEEGANR